MFYRAVATKELSDPSLYITVLKIHFKKNKPNQETKNLNTKVIGSCSFTIGDLWSAYIASSF